MQLQDIDVFEYEKAANKQGYNLVCGVDEAGRGPLAGDVYAAAVILPQGCIIEGLDDSKKLSEKKREKLFDVICEKAIAWSIATATVEEIDSLNILQATFLAMQRAVEALDIKPDYALIDGNMMPPRLPCSGQAIIKGDSLSHSISAASILAKVSRDRYMKRMDEIYPQYQFAKHKGYGTKLHRELILQYGVCEIHRKSFLKKLLG